MQEVKIRLEEAEFADNLEPVCPVFFMLDISGSMAGAPIDALNEGIRAFKDALTDPVAQERVEITIITFNSQVTVEVSNVRAAEFNPPMLSANGNTMMGAAINMALDMARERKNEIKKSGGTYYRPLLYLVTDGEPTDQAVVDQAAMRIREEETRKGVALFSIGVEGANMERLRQISVRAPMKLQGLRFSEMFQWLSASLSVISQSNPGDEGVRLPPLQGWGTLDV